MNTIGLIWNSIATNNENMSPYSTFRLCISHLQEKISFRKMICSCIAIKNYICISRTTSSSFSRCYLRGARWQSSHCPSFFYSVNT